ncbi:MAG: hypothetical protein J4F42_00945, partial [Desulfurellaceae bacterium]|nr:hypothetical protein [Desulfurellaceae bacterium]
MLKLADRIAGLVGRRDLLGYGGGNLVGAQGAVVSNDVNDDVVYAFRREVAHAGPKWSARWFRLTPLSGSRLTTTTL